LDDDQRRNAEAIVAIGGAKMILDADLTPESLAAAIEQTLGDDTLLDAMSVAFGSFARPTAAEDVARVVTLAASA